MKRRTYGKPVTLSQGVEYRDVQGGKFKITRLGEVIRVVDGVYFYAPVNYCSRDRKYALTSYSEDGVQKHFYVHRLVAEAFIPNPNKYPQINHKDGNPSNNCAENLEWCTPSQNIKHAHKTGLIKPMKNAKLCKSCGDVLTKSKTGTCTQCQLRAKARDKQVEAAISRANSVAKFNKEHLDGNEKKAVELRADGMTLQQIGDKLGVTREWVRQLLLKAKKLSTEDFGDRPRYKNTVIELRKKNNLLVADVAKLLEISIPTYSRIENDPDKAKISHIIKLCQLYNVTFDMLVPDILTKIS